MPKRDTSQTVMLVAIGVSVVVTGVAAAVWGAAAILAIVGALVCAAVIARPREGAIIAGLLSPLDQVVVMQTPLGDLRFLELLWLLALLSILARWAVAKPLALTRPPRWLEWMLIAYVGWNLASSLAHGGPFLLYRETAQSAGYALMLYLFAASFATLEPDFIGKCVRGAVIVASVLIPFSLIDKMSGMHLPYIVTVVRGQAVTFTPAGVKEQSANDVVSLVRLGFFDQPIVSAASLMASILVVALAIGLAAHRRDHRLAGWFLAAASGLALTLTFSRAAWAFAVFGVILLAWRIGGRRFLLVLAGLAVVAAAATSAPQVSQRLTNVSTESSTVGHIELWVTAFGLANASPLIGGGLGSFADTTGDLSHNFVLGTAAETGWPGAAIVLALNIGLLWWGLKTLRDAPLIEFAVWVAFAISVAMNLTMNGFYEEMFWIWGGLVAGLCMIRERASATRGHEGQTVAR